MLSFHLFHCFFLVFFPLVPFFFLHICAILSFSFSFSFLFFLPLSSLSGLVKLSELKSSAVIGKSSVPDSLMTQREELALQGPSELDAAGDPESKTVRRRARKTAAGAAGAGTGEEKVKGRRQRDFDPTAVDEDSEDEKKTLPAVPPKEKPSDDIWTQNQQKLLELALQQYPRGTAERWDKIAKVVPGKSKVSRNRSYANQK